MARTGGFRQLKPESLTPFARLVYNYMLDHRPYPLLVSELAELSGVSNNAIWSWFKFGIIPRRTTILVFAERTGLDADALLRAAGYPDRAHYEAQRTAHLLYRGRVEQARRALQGKGYSRQDIDQFMLMLDDLEASITDEAVTDALTPAAQPDPVKRPSHTEQGESQRDTNPPRRGATTGV